MAYILCKLFWLLFLHLPFFVSAQSNSNVTVGSSLSSLDTNSSWTSPSGEFAFGFSPQNDHFLLAIWFAKIPLKTIVWTANDDKPVEIGATVEFTSSGVISLKARNKTEIWRTPAVNNFLPAYAAMLNTGNLVVISSGDATIWESFTYPTDTILPSQVLKHASRIASRLGKEDYTTGRFEFRVQDDGNLVLYTVARPGNTTSASYWESMTESGIGSDLVYNQSGYIYLTLGNGTRIFLSSAIPESASTYYKRATLDFDGVFREYTYPKELPGNGSWPGSWSSSWSLPQNICDPDWNGYDGSGICGFNSYCKLENQMPECICPPGYTYSDPNNTFQGCKPQFVPQTCAGKIELRVADGFKMQEVFSTEWQWDDIGVFSAVSIDWCSETCLNNCLCASALFLDGDCRLLKFPLSQGHMIPDLTGGTTLIKIGNLSTPAPPSTPVLVMNYEKKNKWIHPGSIVLGISAVFVLLFLFIVIYMVFHKKQSGVHKVMHASDVKLQSFTYEELEVATSGFKEELGRGAFSVVYKGMLNAEPDEYLVAVKRLNNLVQGNDREFKTEVSAIKKTNHKNLVQLLGFCDEGSNQILVYEYMRNGSLEKSLFGSFRLDWHRRVQIAFGIAQGLAYLHEDCRSQIIHCDVKPQNILLDDSYEARISDFGLAKLLKSDGSRTLTGIRGTRGYVAPEWFRNCPITAKVDVYSFGIMLLEIICCRKNAQLKGGEEDIDILSDTAYECCQLKALNLLVKDDEEAQNDAKTLEILVMVALCCIQDDPALRPSMKKVIQMLEGTVEVSLPDPSSFCSMA